VSEFKYRRHASSKALLNDNQEELQKYKLQRGREQKITELEEGINTIKAELTDIKELLKDILTKGTL